MSSLTRWLWIAGVVLILCGSASAQSKVQVHQNLVYAEAGGHKLLLDLYLPAHAKKPLLVVYIHGGSWRAGSHKKPPVAWLSEEGYALASISYRLTDKAIFPAQIFDCKSAIRWLRAHADKYGYDATRIAATGSSAGGHLAVLLGTSGGVKELEGDVGGNLGQSSKVQAVVDYYGPTDFILRSKTHPERANQVGSGVYYLLGGPASEKVEMARMASPVTYVTADDPPLLILHGDRDKTVYMDQSDRLRDVYREAQLPVTLQVVPGGAHGGEVFYSGANRKLVVDFLNRHLRMK